MKRKWVLALLATPLAVTLLLAVVGWILPATHTVEGTTTIDVEPAALFDLITDVQRGAEWRTAIESVERLDEADGKPRWVESGPFGPTTLEVVESQPPTRWSTRIADDSLPYGGTWTFVLEPTEQGCRVTITEDGEIRSPVFRAMSRYFFGYHRAVEEYLTDLGKHFGQHIKVTKR